MFNLTCLLELWTLKDQKTKASTYLKKCNFSENTLRRVRNFAKKLLIAVSQIKGSFELLINTSNKSMYGLQNRAECNPVSTKNQFRCADKTE